MARTEYTETYREYYIRAGITREFERSLKIEGSVNEILEILPKAMASLPRYAYPVLQAREDMTQGAFKHLDDGYSRKRYLK